MLTSNASHVANPTIVWTQGMQLGKICCKRNTICKIDPQPYIYMNLHLNYVPFMQLMLLSPYQDCLVSHTQFLSPWNTNMFSWVQIIFKGSLGHQNCTIIFMICVHYFGGLFGNVTFGQLCEWLAGLIMKVNLTPPNIQTKLLSKHPGDICKVPQTGPQFCQNRGWNEMSGWQHNTQEPKKKRRNQNKAENQTRLVFSPKLILAGVSPPVLKFALPEPLD